MRHSLPPASNLLALSALDAELDRRAKILDEALPRVAQAAMRLEPRLRRAVLMLLSRLPDVVDVEALTVALVSGRGTTAAIDAALTALPEAFAARWRPVLLEVFREAATETARAVPVSALSAAPMDLTASLQAVNAEAVDWARRQAAARVVDVTEATRATLREAVTGATAGRQDVRATARLIQVVIGLDARRFAAVDRRRAEWEAAGLAGERLWARVGRLADAYLRQRATVIARTEIMEAANRGQDAVWQRAVRNGVLDRARWGREWVATPDDRLEPVCEALDGTTAPLVGGEFPGGYLGPPAHVNCRCTMRLVEGSPP